MLDIIGFIRDYILGFLVLISILVFVHEMGHYLFAKMFGVKVEAFSIGFGKEIWGFNDKSGTRWKFALFPLGGYVKMKGEGLVAEDNQEGSDFDSFQSKSLGQRFLIVFAGPLFNLVFPIFIILFVSFFVGVPIYEAKVRDIMEDSPSYGILHSGDKIMKFDDSAIGNFSELQRFILLNPGKEVTLQILRDNSSIERKVIIGSRSESGSVVGFLGVTADQSAVTYTNFSLGNSVYYSLSLYTNSLSFIYEGFKRLFTGNVSKNEIGGPIKIAQISGETLQQGFIAWLFFMSILSINLAIINLLPIPALDGGHLMLYTIQFIIRRPISLRIQETLSKIGFLFLMSLMVWVILNDVLSLF